MRIGIVSDTHNNLRSCARIVEIFNAAGVSRVLHSGDITQAKTLRVLADLEAPLCGVFGNNDLERDSLEQACRELDLDFSDPPLRIEWAGRRILVVHDPKDLDAQQIAASDVVFHGHEHRLVLERIAGTLVVNPGECAGHMRGLNAVGLLDLSRLEVEIARF